MRADFRNWPYGHYVTGNSIIYFDRRYRPICRVDDQATVVDSLEWIEHSGKEWFYHDGNQPSCNAETRKRIQNLMDAIPELAAEVARRNKAERRMRELPPRRWPGEHHTVVYGL
jgi:hypothetical protein